MEHLDATIHSPRRPYNTYQCLIGESGRYQPDLHYRGKNLRFHSNAPKLNIDFFTHAPYTNTR